MKKALLSLLLIPSIAFSQNAIIKNLYPIFKYRHKTDTIKSICIPFVFVKNEAISKQINNLIRSRLLGVSLTDTVQPTESLLNKLYTKDNGKKMSFRSTFNKNGLLAININTISSTGERIAPIYFNFDLTRGALVNFNEMLSTRNDSVSIRQAIIPQLTDSIRLYELSIDKNNPKYSEIIEGLNSELSEFLKKYPTDFILTDKELIVYFNCILPNSLIHFNHTYKVSFRYRTLKNVVKPEFIKRLE